MKKAVLVTLILAALTLFASVEKPAALYKESISLLKDGDVKKAFETFQNAVSKDSSILSDKNQYVSGYFMKELEKKTSMLNIAKAYFICGDLKKADSFVKKVLTLYPSTSKEHWEATALKDLLNKVNKKISLVSENDFKASERPSQRINRPSQNNNMNIQLFNRAIGRGGAPRDRNKSRNSR